MSFFALSGCKSFRETYSLVILAFSKTNLEGSIGSNNFYVNVNLAMFQRGPVTQMYCQAVQSRSTGSYKQLLKMYQLWFLVNRISFNNLFLPFGLMTNLFCAHFLILFHQALTEFQLPTSLLMYLSWGLQHLFLGLITVSVAHQQYQSSNQQPQSRLSKGFLQSIEWQVS